MQEVINKRTYAEFMQEVIENVKKTAVDAKALAEDFIVTGHLLREAEETSILGESECKTMGEFAAKYYGITKDVASRYININKKYSVGGNSKQLDSKYSNFGYTKLAEMLTLPEVITEEISPEMTRDEIRAIKNEVAEEKNISDIEVMLEEKDHGVEAEETLIRKVLYQICHEHPDIFKKLWVAVNEISTEVENLQAALAPSGIAMLSCRIPGTGRLMLSVKDIDENLQIINLRSNEKEEITWEELQHVAVTFLQTDAEDWKVAYWNTYNEELPEEKPEVAPAQPKSERVVKSVKPKKPEKSKKTPKEEPEKVEPVAVQEEQLPGQMEVGDYPELMPEKAVEEENDENEKCEDTGRTPEMVPGTAEEGRIAEPTDEAPAEREETPQSNEESDKEEDYQEVRSYARDRMDAVHAVFRGWENEKVIPKEELEMALKNARNLVNAIEKMIEMAGE